jgi:hypothetical protein
MNQEGIVFDADQPGLKRAVVPAVPLLEMLAGLKDNRCQPIFFTK